ncbi:MAG: hypothetical protein PHH37_04030 [Paludibacter sp.]|nr:hypothetical protein [Paludibacter sp.]
MIEILKIILPAILVLITAYFMIDKLLKNAEKQRSFELRRSNLSTVTPIRLRAYERLTLVLERTRPNQLLLNNMQAGMSVLDLQTTLLSAIRHEFNHNASQQIYVSNEVWQALKTTRESLVQLVNVCATKLNPENEAAALAELLIQVFDSTESSPSDYALEILKKEVQTLM